MKLTQVRIQNFRSCRDMTLQIGDMHALVGANNAGKSAVLRALDFLFNPSTKALNDESFWNKDTTLEIRVEAILDHDRFDNRLIFGDNLLALKALESQRNEKHRALFGAQNKVDQQREELIANIEGKLTQRADLKPLFTLRWRLQ